MSGTDVAYNAMRCAVLRQRMVLCDMRGGVELVWALCAYAYASSSLLRKTSGSTEQVLTRAVGLYWSGTDVGVILGMGTKDVPKLRYPWYPYDHTKEKHHIGTVPTLTQVLVYASLRIVT
eukprot:1867435-Rhodomonas_salina.2